MDIKNIKFPKFKDVEKFKECDPTILLVGSLWQVLGLRGLEEKPKKKKETVLTKVKKSLNKTKEELDN